MFDGSMTDIDTNAKTIARIAPLVKQVDGFLEVEAGGQWGGSEDGVGGGAKYSTPQQVSKIQKAMKDADWDEHDYLLAIAFGNAHGTATVANLRPELLHTISEQTNVDNLYVFHGGSGSSLDDIHEAVRNGVVKMNVDTDTQYYFTQGVVDFFENAPKTEDGTPAYRSHKTGKKFFDPRDWNAAGRDSMKQHVIEVAHYLHSEGKIK
jgi:fructose-bisphosphate aldolase class II